MIESIIGDIDRLGKKLGARVAARDLENALEDLASIFEVTLKMETRRHRKSNDDSDDQIAAIMKKIGSRLQSVSNAVTIMPEFCDGQSLCASECDD